MARTTYFAQVSATATRATAVYTTAVNFSNTPPDNSTVLYISSVEIQPSAVNAPYESRLRDVTTGSTLSTTHYSVVAATSVHGKVANGFGLVTYGASPGAQTISHEVRSCAAANVLARSNAYLWGLVLSSNDAFIQGGTAIVSACGNAWVTCGSQLNVSVATSGSFIILSYAEASAQTQGGAGVSAVGTQFRLLIDGSAQEKIYLNRVHATALTSNFIYMGKESWTAGAHRVNLQASWGGGGTGPGTSKVNRVSHVALAVDSFTTAYATADTITVSGSNASYTTAKSFTASITQSASHAILAYYVPGSEASGGSGLKINARYLIDGENITEQHHSYHTGPGSVAGHISSPFIVAITRGLSAVSYNMSVQVGVDGTPLSDYGLTRTAVAVLQLEDAGGGGPTVNNKTVEAVPRAVASVIKTVGANRVAIGRAVANSQKTVNITREAVARTIASVIASIVEAPPNQTTAKSLEAVGVGFASVIKIVSINREAVARGVARADTREIVNQLSAAVAVANASIARNSQFRLTLESVGRAIASISNPAVRNRVFEAVTRAIAEFSSRTTRAKDIIAFARNIANVIKTVNKPIEAVGRGIAADQVGYFENQEGVARGIAILADATRVTASTGTAAVVTANPYVLSLGDSVKRFKSILQHGAGLGRGTTSDRDPDS